MPGSEWRHVSGCGVGRVNDSSSQDVLEGGRVGQDSASSTESLIHVRDPVVKSVKVKGCGGNSGPGRGRLHGQVE